MADAPQPFAPDQMNAALEQLIPVAFGMGVRFTDMSPGRVSATVPYEGNGNHFGVIYAGVIFTVAEVLGGAVHNATFDYSTHYPLVRNLSIDFLKPGKTDLTATMQLSDDEITRIRAEAQPGQKVAFVGTTEVVDTDGVVVAQTRADYQLRPFGM